MQIFDSLLMLLLLLIIGAKAVPSDRRSAWLSNLTLLALLVAVLQLAIEGYRWQMVPSYFVLTIMLVQLGWKASKNNLAKITERSKVKQFVLTSTALLVVLMSGISSYLFPLFELPEPTGPYAIGTSEFHMIDESRLEIYTADPTDRRELMVRAWYPAGAITDEKITPYWRHANIRSEQLTKVMDTPSFLLSHLNLVPTHSYWNAKLNKDEKAFPVLIFSHGFMAGYSEQNTVLMETLASHGYVIFSIDHSYVGSSAIFPDGRVAGFNKEAFGKMGSAAPPEVVAVLEKMYQTTDWHEQLKIMKQGMSMLISEDNPVFDIALKIWAGDQQFVLSQIKKLQLGQPMNNQTDSIGFKDSLDLSRLGFFGMSFGGSTALENCVTDPRCKAGINLDGFQVGQVELPALQRPFMFINSEQNHLYNEMYEKSQSDVFAVSIEGATHLNNLDFSIMSPLYKMMGVLGPIDGYKMLKITDDYVLAFFDQYLKQKSSPLLESSTSEYDEVNYKHRNKTSTNEKENIQ